MEMNEYLYRLVFLAAVISCSILTLCMMTMPDYLHWQPSYRQAYGSLNISTNDSFYASVNYSYNIALTEDEIDLELGKRFELYVRLTNTVSFRQQLDDWLFKSMNLFFAKYLASTVVVLDSEKSADWDYGKVLLKRYSQMNLRLCFMNPVPGEIIHYYGKERMYLDMMHADFCSKREYVGFVDVDTLFVTAVTEDVLFENQKPIVTGRIGIPRIPCWIATAEYILGYKQVMQCMSYFPVVFKVLHIVEMRKHVEKIHNKTFLEVFKIAPAAIKVDGSCFCHYSIMCNYVWYHHREAYAWHLQVVPGGKWNGIGAIPSMVNASYFENEVLASEKIPIPRSSVHARHLMVDGKYLDAIIPARTLTNRLMKEGICYSFGFEVCPEKCTEFSSTEIQHSLFAFENYRWQWDSRCFNMQERHYAKVHELVKFHPEQFYLDVQSNLKICSILDSL